MIERDKALRKARKTNTAADWKAYRKIRNKCPTDLRTAKGNYSRPLLNRNSRNPKKFWDTIKTIMPTKTRKVTNDATTTTNKFEKLKDFIWNKPKHSLLRTNMKFEFNYISRVFVEKELKKLKRQKSTGSDNLPAALLKDCASAIAEPLCYLINLSLDNSEVPSDRKNAHNTPILKSGSPSEPNNY
ncbi:uncharacterized protein LOC130628795 [Hydractinia symbiolongicarpus]|uniref:uncharacterized protein LOC130628795 n=1 Tax=Hydractinia symbiolongicarpus TaxID=13093 RepID=UPI00254FECD4|nr:uncharacterized protein LOC130628795 [Hydractinia symbiolongicarpus]